MSHLVVEGHPPSATGLLEHLDEAAAAAAKTAAAEVEGVARPQIPRRTGRLAAATKVRVSRAPRGYAVTVGITKGAGHDRWATAAEVSRWVQRGTGIYRQGGGSNRRIRSKRLFGSMTLPGGAHVRSVKGQHPNPYMRRIAERAEPMVLAAFEAGAREVGGRLL